MLCVRVTVGRRRDGEMWASCKRVLVELKGTQIAGSHSLVVGTRGDTTQFLIMWLSLFSEEFLNLLQEMGIHLLTLLLVPLCRKCALKTEFWKSAFFFWQHKHTSPKLMTAPPARFSALLVGLMAPKASVLVRGRGAGDSKQRQDKYSVWEIWSFLTN